MRRHIRIGAAVFMGAVAIAALGTARPAAAQGFIVVDEPTTPVPPIDGRQPRYVPFTPVEVRSLSADVDVTGMVAVTSVEQTFYNPCPRQLEGTYIFPLPEGAAVDRFSMEINGKETTGEMLDAGEARRIYEAIVAKMRDPGLLEYCGDRMFRARVFPIPPNGEVRVKLSFSQALTADNGLVSYAYPLRTQRFSNGLIGDLAVRLHVRPEQRMSTIYCPTHDATIDRRGDREAVVSFKGARHAPEQDFAVFWQLSKDPFDLSVITHRESGEDGYFMARISPPWEQDQTRVLPKDICFVFDTSGSMAGRKMDQAKAALEFCIGNLNERDRFNILSFSSEARPFRDRLIEASRDARNDAMGMVSALQATGGTNINDALVTALEMAPPTDGDRRFMIIFLTDGLPTVGERNIATILKNVRNKNTAEVRVFAFGLGDDVNTRLLDKLAEQNHGSRSYVAESEDLEVKLSSFYERVASPVLNDLSLAFGGAEVYDVFPKALPDLFHGTEVVVFGRYAGSGQRQVTLKGNDGERDRTFDFEATFHSRNLENDFLPQLWAIRKVGFLLDELRLHGETKELKDEIVRIGKRYGIITPYTSYLIAEEAEMARADGRAVQGALRAMEDNFRERDAALQQVAAAAPASMEASVGGAAVAQSKSNTALQSNAGVFGGPVDEIRANQMTASGERVVNQIGAQTFYKDEKRWIDSRYDGDQETVKVKAFSTEYFDLVNRHPELRRQFAQGANVIVVIDGQAYETVDG